MVKKLYQLQPSILKEANFVSENIESIEIKPEQGNELRERVPRDAHSGYIPPSDWRDPIDILIEFKEVRLENPIPICYGRMIQNPFTFLGGFAVGMAYDLSHTPVTGSTFQACGCTMANAHGRSGDPSMTAGYLGKSDVFYIAMADFARESAAKTVKDHQVMMEAIKSGRIKAQMDT